MYLTDEIWESIHGKRWVIIIKELVISVILNKESNNIRDKTLVESERENIP